MACCCQISHLCLLYIIVLFVMIFSGLLINKFSYKYSVKRVWNPTVIFWICGRHFLPAGCLLMWKRAHFTFKSTSAFLPGVSFSYSWQSQDDLKALGINMFAVLILLSMEIDKHKNCLLENKAPNMPQNENNHRLKITSVWYVIFIISCSIYNFFKI